MNRRFQQGDRVMDPAISDTVGTITGFTPFNDPIVHWDDGQQHAVPAVFLRLVKGQQP